MTVASGGPSAWPRLGIAVAATGLAVGVFLLVAGDGPVPAGAPESEARSLPYFADESFTPLWYERHSDLPSGFHAIGPFSLVDHRGAVVTEATLRGKVYVANFFFTACPGICPTTMANLARLQSELGGFDDVAMVSHSLAPEADDVPNQGLLGELDSALTTYSALEGYDADDLVGAVHDVREEIAKLRHFHGRLWDLFRPVRNKRDMEAMERFLADQAIRDDFYARLRAFTRCLHISMSSEKIFDVFDEGRIAEMKRDWRAFSDLRKSVRIRYQEAVDVREFEPKIKRLLDDHVAAMPVETVVPLVDIHDTGVLKEVVEETGITPASKADRIASATRRAITEHMDMDPAFYERFSKLLDDTIREYRAKRMSEQDYLDSVVGLASKVAGGHGGGDVPAALRGNDHGMAFFGIFDGAFEDACGEPLGEEETAEAALAVMDIIREHRIVDVWSNETAQNDMRNAIDDYFYDVLRDEKGIELTEARMDDLLARIMRLAQARFQ